MVGEDAETSIDASTLSRRAFTKAAGLALFSGPLVGGSDGSETGESERRIVGVEPGHGTDAIVQQSASVENVIEMGSLGTAVVGQFDPDAVTQLEDSSSIRYVESDADVSFPESDFEISGESSVSGTEGQLSPWGCERIGATDLYDSSVTGSGVDVAVIDSGIDSNHPDLRGNVGDGYAATSCVGPGEDEDDEDEDENGSDEDDEEGEDEGDDGVHCHSDWDDDHSHGTHCAGIVGALDNGRGVVGVATNVTLHAVKVMTAVGSGDASDIADGIVWAADQGFDVANLSIGGDSPSEAVHDAIKYAEENGMVVVAAAGNDGPCSDCLHYPGAYDETVCVGSVDSDDELASHSSTGDAVDIVAPGAEVPSTIVGGEYRAFSGTSMATPHVTGALALLVDRGYSPSEARDRLLESAEDLGLAEDESGAGLVDCQAALSGRLADDIDVETRSVTAVGEADATVTGALTKLSETDSVTVAVEYWPAAESAGAATRSTVGDRSSTGEFTATLTDLDEDTEYRYRAVATADETTVVGTANPFTTGAGVPDASVTTTDPTDILATRATFTGEVTELVGTNSATVRFEYWVEGERDETATTTGGVELTETGTFSQQATGLEPGSTYVVRAEAVAAGGTPTRGEPTTFTTPESLAVGATGASDVKLYGATLHGEILTLGDAAGQDVTTGFRYWKEEQGRDSASETAAPTVTDPVPFESGVADLQSDTTYRYEAFARPEDGDEATSDAATFTTGSAPG